MKPSARHARDAEALLAFRNAYVALLNAARYQGDGYALPTLVPKVDGQQWQRLRHEVASTAGAAGHAAARFGGTMTLRNAAYVMHGVDPISNWEISLRDPEQLRPESLLAVADAAVAAAQRAARDAAERERGLTDSSPLSCVGPARYETPSAPGTRLSGQPQERLASSAK